MVHKWPQKGGCIREGYGWIQDLGRKGFTSLCDIIKQWWGHTSWWPHPTPWSTPYMYLVHETISLELHDNKMLLKIHNFYNENLRFAIQDKQYIQRKNTRLPKPQKKVSSFWSLCASSSDPHVRIFSFLFLGVAMKRCPNAAKIAGSIRIRLEFWSQPMTRNRRLLFGIFYANFFLRNIVAVTQTCTCTLYVKQMETFWCTCICNLSVMSFPSAKNTLFFSTLVTITSPHHHYHWIWLSPLRQTSSWLRVVFLSDLHILQSFMGDFISAALCGVDNKPRFEIRANFLEQPSVQTSNKSMVTQFHGYSRYIFKVLGVTKHRRLELEHLCIQ